MLDAHIDRALLDNFLTEYKPDYLWLPVEKAKEFDGETVFEQGNYALVKMADGRAYPLYDEFSFQADCGVGFPTLPTTPPATHPSVAAITLIFEYEAINLPYF